MTGGVPDGDALVHVKCPFRPAHTCSFGSGRSQAGQKGHTPVAMVGEASEPEHGASVSPGEFRDARGNTAGVNIMVWAGATYMARRYPKARFSAAVFKEGKSCSVPFEFEAQKRATRESAFGLPVTSLLDETQRDKAQAASQGVTTHSDIHAADAKLPVEVCR